MFEIIIQDESLQTVGKLDLFDNEIPLITRSKNWLAVDEQSVLYSTQIKIPKTANNVSLFQISKSGNIVATSFLSVQQYQEMPCIVRYYGIEVVQNLKIKLDKVDNEFIYLRLFEGKRIIQQLISDTLLTGLDFDSLNHQRTAEIIGTPALCPDGIIYGIDKIPNGTFFQSNGEVGGIDNKLFDATMAMNTLGVPGNNNNYGTFPTSRIYPKIKVNKILEAIGSYLGATLNFIGNFPQKENLLIDFTNETSTIYDRLQLCETIWETETDYELTQNTNAGIVNPSHSQLIGCFKPKKQGVTYLGDVKNLELINEFPPTGSNSKANLTGRYILEQGDAITFFFNIKSNAYETLKDGVNISGNDAYVANHIDIYISYDNGITKGKIGTARPIPTKNNFDNYFFQYTYLPTNNGSTNISFWAVSKGVYYIDNIAPLGEWQDLEPGNPIYPFYQYSPNKVKLLKGSLIKAKVLEYNKVWEVSKNLPKISIKDFLNAFCIHYGACYEILNQVSSSPQINIIQKNENTGVLDWTNKLVDNNYTQDNNETISNQINLAFESDSQKDSVLLTENVGVLQTPKMLLNSKFALVRPKYNRTVFVKSQPKVGPNAPTFLGDNEYPNNYQQLSLAFPSVPRLLNTQSLEIIFEKNKKVPNIFLIDTLAISNEKIIIYDEDFSQNGFRWVTISPPAQTSFGHFPKELFKGFVLPAIDTINGIAGLNDIEVIKAQYKWLNSFMKNPLKFSITIYLNLTDFLQFDFYKLVYIKQFESYFRVEKLGQWSPDKPLTVTFLKYTPTP